MALERQLNIELKVKQGAENMIPIYANGATKVSNTHKHTHTQCMPSETPCNSPIIFTTRWSVSDNVKPLLNLI